MTAYAEIIKAATGETDSHRLFQIEDIMRRDIFHSTLDWQTREQLEDGARQAQDVLRYLREFGSTLPGYPN